MKLINNLSELRENLIIFESYRYSPDKRFRSAQSDLVEKGIIFVAHMSGGRCIFSPSRFLGYKSNTLNSHNKNTNKDGKETTPVISNIIGSEAQHDSKLEKLYLEYCLELGVTPNEKGSFGVERKYWKL